MMFKLNRIRNKANAIIAMYLTNELHLDDFPLEATIQFPFDTIMINLNLSKSHFSEAQLNRFGPGTLTSID